MKLFGRPQDDLNWKIEGSPSLFEFELGLNIPFFSLEDELYFNAIAAALTRFTEEIWPQFPESKAILYRGSADFSRNFLWTERQEENYSLWQKEMPEGDPDHLKRLFCAECFVHYFQMLAHKLPDELPIILQLEGQNIESLASTLQLLSPERFEHFLLETNYKYHSNIGICFPPDAECSKKILNKLDLLLASLPSFRPVYENLLTEQWDGLDEIYILPEALTDRGKRKLQGFEAAGGKVNEFRGRGIFPQSDSLRYSSFGTDSRRSNDASFQIPT